jgi:hypothetical protein
MLKDPKYFFNVAQHISLEKMIEYHRLYPTSYPRRKFNGFENMNNLWVETQKKLSSQFPEESKIYMIPISDIKFQLNI